MVSKWTVYFLTFATYATFHSIRSSWAGLKNMFFAPPFNYSIDFLGLMDMIVLFTLALTLGIFGHKVQKFGAKRCILIGMSALIILTTVIGVLLLHDVTSKPLYIILFGLCVGVLSATGWPSCLYLLSQYFDKRDSTSLPIWNGCSQFGDFLALFISDIVIERLKADVSITLIIIPFLMLIVVVLNAIYLPSDKKKQEQPSVDQNELNQQKSQEQKRPASKIQVQIQKRQNLQNLNPTDIKDVLVEAQQGNMQQKKQILQLSEKQTQNSRKNEQVKEEQVRDVYVKDEYVNDENVKETGFKLSQANLQISEVNSTPVDFTNVWCLPGVAMYVTAYAIIKSINTIIMTWLVFYLSLPSMDMKEQSRIIAILWFLGVFGGGVIGGKVNPTYSKYRFIFFLSITSAMFLTLGRMHQKIYQIQISITIIICSLAYGVPYNMLSTAVPIMLSQSQQIKNRPGAKAAIISLMQGFGLGVCGLSILLVPLVGVNNINWVLMIYSLIGISILSFAIFSQRAVKSKNLPTVSNTQREQKESIC